MAGEVIPALPVVIDAFAEDCGIRKMTDESIRRYVSAIRILYNFCEVNHLDIIHIKGEDLVNFLKYLIETRKNSQKTISNVFNSLSTFYEFLTYKNWISGNPVPPIRKRYVRTYKTDIRRVDRRILTVEEMAQLIYGVFDIRDRAMLILLAKTGIRRNELITLDVDDVDILQGKIILKPTSKRSNRVVFIDEECSIVLREWLVAKKNAGHENPALFINTTGTRINRNDVYLTVTKWAERAGFHQRGAKNPAMVFSPHSFRHWFTTHLIRSGMPRDYIKELRGDARKEAIDLYNHIDLNDLKRVYLTSIPRLFDT